MLKKIFAVITSLIIAGSGLALASSREDRTSGNDPLIQGQSSAIELATHRTRNRSVEPGENPRTEAEEALRNARRERLRAQARAVRERAVFPTDLARQFDDLLTQAQTAFNGGSFLEAEDLAKGAKKGFKAIERRIKRMDRIDNSGRSNSGRR